MCLCTSVYCISFPNIQYSTFDLLPRVSHHTSPCEISYFNQYVSGNKFQRLNVMLLSFRNFTTISRGIWRGHWLYVNGACKIQKGKADLASWSPVLRQVLKWKPLLPSARAVAILREGTMGSACIIYELDTHSSLNLWATSTQSLCH